MDKGIYRISQTSTRNMSPDLLTANYNEALAYGYWSISGYTSNPDNAQRVFLDRLGYRINGANFCITNTSILPADALMSVKYVLSPYEIRGLEMLADSHTENEKKIYQNPYCLPFAFRYNKAQIPQESGGNPFAYQNNIYAALTGKEGLELFLPVSYHTEHILNNSAEHMSDKTEDLLSDTVIYHLDLPDGNFAVYGNIRWDQEMDAVVKVNDIYSMGYAQRKSPSVFYIPAGNEEAADVQITAGRGLSIKEEQFYALDLDKLAVVSQEISRKAAQEIQVKNGYAEFTVEDAKKGEYLYTSVPYDEGWQIMLNGEKVNAEMFADCMITVGLHSGKNVIRMEYRVPYLRCGILMTLAGIILLYMVIRRYGT